MKPTKQQLAMTLLEKGVKSLLDEAKVPMHVHLKVTKALHEAMKQHKADLAAYDERFAAHENKLVELHGKVGKAVEKVLTTDWTGPKGDQGEEGKSIRGDKGDTVLGPTVEEVTMRLLPLVIANMPTPASGLPGKDAETPSTDKLVEDVIRELQKGDKLHISHVRGGAAFIKDGIKYRFEELMHGGGSTSSGAFTVLTISGTVDDSNVSFTSTSEPTLLNINGGFYQKTGGSITWSYAAGVITLSSPAGAGGSIYAIK